MGQVTRQDARLVGARHLAQVSASRMAVAAGDARAVVMLDIGNACAIAGAVALTRKPGAIVHAASKLWTVTEDGYLLRLTTADTPVLEASTDLDCERPRWVAAAGSIILAPTGPSGVASFNSASAELDQVDGVLPEIEFAVATSAYLYAIGHGRGAVLSVTAAGLLRKVAEFAATDAHGVLGGFIDGTSLVLAIDARESVAIFTIASAEAPARTSRSTYAGYTLRGVLNNSDRSPLTEEPRTGLSLIEWWKITAGLRLSTGALVYLHPEAGRVTSVPTNTAPSVNAGLDRAISLPTTSLSLAGVVSDDGLPVTSTLSYSWSQVSGPATATFSSPAVLAPVVSGLSATGTYVFRLTATDGEFTTTDDVTVYVNPSAAVSLAFNNAVYVVYVDATNNRMWFGGEFSQVDNGGGYVTRNYLCGVNLATGLLLSAPNYTFGSFSGQYISGFSVPPGSTKIFVAASSASFTVDGNARAGGFAFDTDGVLLSFNPQLNALCETMVSDATNIWYLGDAFTTAGGASRTGSAKWRVSDFALDATYLPTVPVNTITNPQQSVLDDPWIYAGAYQSASDFRIRRWDKTTGAHDTRWEVKLTCSGVAYEPRLQNLNHSGEWLYIVGEFTQVDSYLTTSGGSTYTYAATQNAFVAVHKTTGAIRAMNPGFTNAQSVLCMALGGGYLYLGYEHTFFSEWRIRAFDPATGSEVSSGTWTVPSCNGRLNMLFYYAGHLHIVGNFTTFGGASHTRYKDLAAIA